MVVACPGESPTPKPDRPESTPESGWGSFTVEPNRIIRMDETPTFTLTYTVERPMGHESSIFFGVPNPFSRPQHDDPEEYGYTEVASSNEEVTPSLVLGEHRGWGFRGWGWLVEIRWEGALGPGDEITLTYGKGKGVELGDVAFALVFRGKARQNFPEQDHFFPDPPPIPLSGTEPVSLIVTAPSTAAVNEPFEVSLVPRDAMDNASLGFREEVRPLTRQGSNLSSSYFISMSEPGANVIRGVQFREPGIYRIAFSGLGGIRGESNPIRVTEDSPAERIYWGELHIHTAYSDGLGTPETAYLYGRDVADIDFMGVTDHAELVTDEEWHRTQEAAKTFNQPGRFITFLAQEWSGPTERGGDHNVFHLDDDQPLYRSNEPELEHVTDLYAQLEHRRAFTVPHVGGRVANLDYHDSDVQRGIEIYSNHGIFELHTQFALQKGYELGVIAASDGHDGNAGYSNWLRQGIRRHGGLTAVRARELTREAVYDALFNRRVYATTGERILLDFTVNGHGMGEIFTTSDTPVLEVNAEGTAPLERVDVVRNDTCVKTLMLEGKPSVSFTWRDDDVGPGLHYYMVRVVQEPTQHQRRVKLPRKPGVALRRDEWKGPIRLAPDSGAPSGPFEIEHHSGTIAWSTPIWVRTN